MTTVDNEPAARPTLPADPAMFFRSGPGIDALVEPAADVPPALERLGPAPFRKGRFPVLGFLATLYDHTAGHTGESRAAPAAQ